MKLWKCILESPPGNDPAEIRRCNGKRMVSANDDDIQIDVCISWSAICKLACLSVIQCQAGRPLPQRCGRNRRGGDPPPRSAGDARLRPLSSKNLRMRGASQFAIVCKPARPGALIVCDLGVRARAVLDALPTCFIDYHYFSDAPLNGVVITGFQAEPCPTSGLIAFWCANAIADVSDLEWIAAISLLSDVGERAPFAELTSAKNVHGLSALREAITLLNAARRPSSGNAEPALRRCCVRVRHERSLAVIHPTQWSTNHGFPPDFPSPDVAVGLLSINFSHPAFYCVVAESDGCMVGRTVSMSDPRSRALDRSRSTRASRIAALAGN